MDTLKIFCSYAPEDEKLMERFHAHLRGLEPLNITIFYTHDILAGMEWERERDKQLQNANIILLLVSAYFINSQERYQNEVLPAMKRHNSGKARVIPIILRHVSWQGTAFGKLLPLPARGKPVTDTSWDRDTAFVNIITGIKLVIEKIRLTNQQENPVTNQYDIVKSATAMHNASAQLGQIIQNFKVLRGQTTSIVQLRSAKDVNLETCEKQYNRLYGDTMVFLTAYLPQRVTDDDEGFVETVYRKTTKSLKKDNMFDVITVFTARALIPQLAQLEKLGMQIDACVTTLESYKQRYF